MTRQGLKKLFGLGARAAADAADVQRRAGTFAARRVEAKHDLPRADADIGKLGAVKGQGLLGGRGGRAVGF